MTKLVNRAKMTTATTGTGTITLGSASSGYQSFASAGVVNADVVRYVIEDGTSWEIGTGTYTASGTTLSRTPSESSAGGAAISLSGNAEVYVTASAEDLNELAPLASPTFTGDVTIADKIIHSGDTNTAIRFPAADTVTIESGGVERFRVDSVGGRIGIGVTNPAARLQVAALSSSSPTIIAATETNYLADFRSSQLAYFPVDATGTTFGFSNSNLGALSFLNTTNAVIGTNGNTPMAFATTSVERMRITGAGNVGIGTSSPAVPLEIGGQATLSLRLLTTTNAVDFRIQTIGPSASTVLNNVSNHPLAIFTNNTERMRITSAGNVGIGTSSPQRALQIAAAEPAIVLQETDQATDESRWRIYMEGSDILITTANDAFNASQVAYRIARGDGIAVDTHQWQTAGAERMRITSAGNLGIGTNSPSTRLHVAGDTTFGGAIDETVFALTGTTPALDPSNGTIQTWTLSANSSPTDSLNDGESLTLMIDDGSAFTVTWPSVTWKTDAGVAPTLNTTGFTVVILWKVSTTLYGARVGDA